MKSQLIVGMPNSGKSTYIGALRHLLIANEVQTELELHALAESELHLNRLEREWLDCVEVERTKPSTEGWVEFHVTDRSSGAQSVLKVPDLRGEAFEQPACMGQCDKGLFEALINTDGILLFTNADREDDAVLIEDLSDLIDIGESSSEAALSAFVPENMPEEVKIVEFLQVANRRPQQLRIRKLAVLISAWDVVEGEESPERWFHLNRPMLSQFLRTNSDLWELRVYGVSAQGGRLPQQKSRLSAMPRPSERIKIVGHGAAQHDLSSPLRWLISSEL